MTPPLLDIPLTRLHAHPDNSNVMPAPLLAKLAAHIERTGRYPPLIVRPLPAPDAAPDAGSDAAPGPDADPHYQLLDGHHRALALRQLQHTTARCLLWDVPDDEALLLLTTLNRLQGDDDPARRAALIDRLRLAGRLDLPALAALLPEDHDHLQKLLRLTEPPTLRPPRPLDDLPVALHFFVTPAQRRAIESLLRAQGTTREAALLHLLHLEESPTDAPPLESPPSPRQSPAA